MALNDILTSMDGARDALVTAINAKGGSLADNATLYQCADAVGSLSGGTSAEYYKCASVDTSAKTWSGYKAVFDSTAGTWSFSDTVTEGLSYRSLRARGCPCGSQMYYDFYRKFFWLLSIERG